MKVVNALESSRRLEDKNEQSKEYVEDRKWFLSRKDCRKEGTWEGYVYKCQNVGKSDNRVNNKTERNSRSK